MEYDVRRVDERRDGVPVRRRADDDGEARPANEMLDVLEAAGREIVEHVDFPAAVEQRFSEVRPDEPRAAGDERSDRHEAVPASGTRARTRSSPTSQRTPK